MAPKVRSYRKAPAAPMSKQELWFTFQILHKTWNGTWNVELIYGETT
jgi:hypothetical protein